MKVSAFSRGVVPVPVLGQFSPLIPVNIHFCPFCWADNADRIKGDEIRKSVRRLACLRFVKRPLCALITFAAPNQIMPSAELKALRALKYLFSLSESDRTIGNRLCVPLFGVRAHRLPPIRVGRRRSRRETAQGTQTGSSETHSIVVWLFIHITM